jgi:TIR domain
MTEKPKVFISYSHRDEEYAQKLLRHLKVLGREADFDVWSDRKIEVGQDWHNEIKRHIEKARIAILLVSADYLASEWIAQEELPALLEEQSQRGLRILPLVVSPSLWKNTPLAYYQLLPRDGKALSSLSGPEQDMVPCRVS